MRTQHQSRYGAVATALDIEGHDARSGKLEESSSCISDGSDDDVDADEPIATTNAHSAAAVADLDERQPLHRRRRRRPRVSLPPVNTYAWWSQPFFPWCAPLARLCAQRPLRVSDLWRLDTLDTSTHCAAELQQALTSTHSLVLAALWTQWRLVLASGVLSLVAVVCELIGPIAVFYVVDAAAQGDFAALSLSPSASSASSSSSSSRGAWWTLILLATRLVRSATLTWSDHLLRRVDARVNGALQVLLLERVLVLQPPPRCTSPASTTSAAADNDLNSATERAANLFTLDAALVGSSVRVLHRLWALPLALVGLASVFQFVAGRLVVSRILLVSLGVYALVQLAAIAEVVALRAWLTTSDKRFRILERVLQHVQAIKLSSWEDWAIAQVLAARTTEERGLQRFLTLRALRVTLAWIAPALNLIATGVLLVNTTTVAALASPAFTFSAVAIFHALNDTLTIGVHVASVLGQLRVALDRIRDALHAATDAADGSSSRLSMAHDSTASSGRTATAAGDGSDDALIVVGASFAHASAARLDRASLLANVSLRVTHGEFVVVYGSVGCGKSVLLAALLGFFPKQQGGVYVHGRVAYCSQVPWLQAQSIRDNVLFGRTFDAVRYWSVLDACCLLPDVAHLPAGDRTLVGSHGPATSLSSGQQARVALARACYADADIYVLDAPLDSVDSIVQCAILLECLGKLLQHKTIVMTTHNPELIRSELVDRAIWMDAMVLQPPKRSTTTATTSSSRVHRTAKRSAPSHHHHHQQQPFQSKRSQLLGTSATQGGLSRRRHRERTAAAAAAAASSSPSTNPRTTLRLNDAVLCDPLVRAIEAAATSDPAPATTSSTATTHINHASCAYRHVGWRAVLKEYVAYTQSFRVLCVVVCLHVVTQVLATTSIYCFSRWIASTGGSVLALSHTIALFERYVTVVAASCVAFLAAAIATFACSLAAANKLFVCMTTALLHAPLRFFATHPVGRILNRYARDLRAVDLSLHSVLFALLRSSVSAYCSLFASLAWLSGHALKLHSSSANRNDSMALWWVVMAVNAVVTTVVLGAFWRHAVGASKPSGELYLMFRETQSPLFGVVNESLLGKHVIAAFGSTTRRDVARCYGSQVDNATRVLLAMWSFETFVTLQCLVRESLLTGALLVALVVLGHDMSLSDSPATIGLLLFLVLNLSDDLTQSAASWTLLEKDLACVQRVLEYIDVTPEGNAHSIDAAALDPFWPRAGAITFESVDFRYDVDCVDRSRCSDRRPLEVAAAAARRSLSTECSAAAATIASASSTSMHNLICDRYDRALALRNVSFHIDGGLKIGVVGRSGAGKSSLAMALMRICDPVGGVIRIDGVDITTLHLKTLRSKISYVPPTPVFANATLREYLDPMQHYIGDDVPLWRVLRKTRVERSVRKLQASLDTSIFDMVGTWSAGERQLLCLARALVLRSRIVILDEATTATDQETDGSVQDVVRELLDASTTLLCIAHRLDTVLEFDKILVMANGGVEDFGTVQELVAAGDGVFYHLLESAQLVY